MNNKECATVFSDAIRQLASKPDNLDNFESYLSMHFDTWLERFANTPEDMVVEIKHFATMEI